MLPKQQRVDTKNINRIFKEGKFLVSSHFTFKFIQTGDGLPCRISFIAPKGVAQQAVVRNKLRRLGYTILTKHIHSAPSGIMGAFVFKQYEDDVSILDDEIKGILSKIN